MQYEPEIGVYVEAAVWTGRISTTSDSEAVAVLTNSKTWSFYVLGAMEWRTDFTQEPETPPRYILGSLRWCLVDTPPRLPLSEGQTLRNYAAVANFERKSMTTAFYGSIV